MGCLLTMIRPSACTWRWAAIDLAGSGGGVAAVRAPTIPAPRSAVTVQG